MAKWADYCISAVKYDSEKKHIEKVKVHKDLGDTIEAPSEWTRTKVVETIEKGSSFITITTNDKGNWKKGEDVHIITVKGKKYLRTDNNETEEDNLGNLPEF
ncbi:DUF3892 domain-containing protein [bacterium]|nr:DUF3892 domain-containing protein [bacterium]MBU1063418.1 DUF3892 domain-containing protein [bacterium]MBU1635302.1 DUF3892 domain-containing protein [bacterium]MBU1873315.1 DUF3892 domain-containing protein [bacterium]